MLIVLSLIVIGFPIYSYKKTTRLAEEDKLHDEKTIGKFGALFETLRTSKFAPKDLLQQPVHFCL